MICPELSILEYNLSGHPKISRVAVASIGDLTYSRSTTQHNGCQSYFPLPQPPCIASRSFGCHAFVHFFNLNTQGWTQQSRFEIARSRPVQSRLSTVGPDLDAIPVEADGLSVTSLDQFANDVEKVVEIASIRNRRPKLAVIVHPRLQPKLLRLRQILDLRQMNMMMKSTWNILISNLSLMEVKAMEQHQHLAVNEEVYPNL